MRLGRPESPEWVLLSTILIENLFSRVGGIEAERGFPQNPGPNTATTKVQLPASSSFSSIRHSPRFIDP
jgi:hypothetical protein